MENNLEQIIPEFIELCRKISERYICKSEYIGWKSRKGTNDITKLGTYYMKTDQYTHRAVWLEDIQVSFHPTPTISCAFNLLTADNLTRIIKLHSSYLK